MQTLSSSNTPTLPFQGKSALVTGASRNLGAAFAQALFFQGANVLIHFNSDSSRDSAEKSLNKMQQVRSGSYIYQADLTNSESTKKMFDYAEEKLTGIDIVVHNAGEMHKSPFIDTTEEDFEHIFSVNTKASFHVLKEAGKRINDHGRILNIGTSLLAAFTGNYATYAGSKAPLEDFSRALAKELGHRGITINTLCPGPVDTSFLNSSETKETLAWLASASPLNRLGRIDDITPWVTFLCSEESRWATGQTFFVNGGFVTR